MRVLHDMNTTSAREGLDGASDYHMHLAEPASILTGQSSASTDRKDCISGLSAHLVHVAAKQLIVLFQPLHEALGRYHAGPLLLRMYLQAMGQLSEVQHYSNSNAGAALLCGNEQSLSGQG